MLRNKEKERKRRLELKDPVFFCVKNKGYENDKDEDREAPGRKNYSSNYRNESPELWIRDSKSPFNRRFIGFINVSKNTS